MAKATRRKDWLTEDPAGRWIVGDVDSDGTVRKIAIYADRRDAEQHLGDIAKWWPNARVLDRLELECTYRIRREG